MAKTRMVMELGMGVSLVSQDYTKAACRAVQDALYRNSLSLPFVFGGTPADMIVELEVAVQQPDQVDIEQVQMSRLLFTLTLNLEIADATPHS
jgi:uncharacterized protein (TIGR02058 family)